ncbi:hypothetical protein JCM8547_004356 [Rhodosporidiobolus lusitaniae]
MSDSGSSPRVSPAIPQAGSSNGYVYEPSQGAPPPPKTFRVSSSPLMADAIVPASPNPPSSHGSPAASGSASPSSTSMTPSRSWQRIQPPQPFVNGRGNVQLPGAPQRFVPSGSPSHTSPSHSPALSNGSPVLGVQKEGHQAYVRRDPSPGPSRLPPPGESPPLAGAVGPDGAAFLPSQFGVRQRVALKTSTRPPPPRSTLAGGSAASAAMGRRGSAASSVASGTYEMGGSHLGSPVMERGKSADLPPIPSDEKGKGPMYPPSFVTASPAVSSDSHFTAPQASSSFLHPDNPSSAPTSDYAHSPSSPPSRSPNLSPAPPQPQQRSILDRGRPKTPDPFGGMGGASSFASRGGMIHAPLSASSSGTSVLDRPRPKTPDPVSTLQSSARLSPELSRSTPASFTASQQPQHQKTSVLDRPRPKTPDAAGSLFRFGEEGRGSRPHSRVDADGAGERSGTKTPEPAGVFAFSVPPLAYGSTGEPEDQPQQEKKKPTSVMDRPRPKTPDAQGVFDSVGAGAVGGFGSAGSNATVKASQIPFGGYGGSGLGSQAGGSRTTSPILERKGGAVGASTSTSSFASSVGAGGNTSYDSLASRTLPSGLPSATTASSTSHSYSTSTSTLNSQPHSTFNASPARPSFDFTTPSSASPARPLFSGFSSATPPLTLDEPSTPLLRLDFDFGGSPFGTSETMFGLSDLLKFGSSSSNSPAPPLPSSNGLAPPVTENEEDATTPTPTSERKDLGAAYVAHSPTSTSPSPALGSASAATTPSISSSAASFLAPAAGNSIPSGRSTPRKEPPKVDLRLELELEMERAIPPNRGVLDAGRESREEDRVKRVRRARDDEEFGSAGGASLMSMQSIQAGGGKQGPLVREQASISSFGSMGGAGGTAASISDASSSGFGGAGQSPKAPKRRRRRSLASLLSIGGSSLLGKDKGKERERDEEERPGRSRTPEPGMRSFTPEPGMSTASHAALPALVFPPTSSTFAPRLSLDKSLPPTPLSPSPNDQHSPRSSSAFDHAPQQQQQQQQPETSSPTKQGPLGRQLSRLRNRSTPSPIPQAQPQPPRQPAFQVISATTTRQNRRTGGSISSLGTSDTHGSHLYGGGGEQYRRESNEFGVLPKGGSGPFSTLAPAAQPGLPPVAPPMAFQQQQPPSFQPSFTQPPPASSSLPFGRRFVERFTKNSASKTAATPSSSSVVPTTGESWTAPVKDHSAPTAAAGPHGPTRHGKRRTSLSSLLGVTSSASQSADGHGGPSMSGPKRILGMSLPAGRKSEDLLISGRGQEREMRREWEEPAKKGETASASAAAVVAGAAPGRRRSFDLLTDREAIPRRPSTDDLLNLATAKLSRFAVEDQPPNTASTMAPPLSAEASTFEESGDTSSLASGTSTPSDELAAKATAVVAHAALINRSDPPSSAPIAAAAGTDPDVPLYGSRTAAPVLVRSDSLRSGPGASTSSVPATSALPSLSNGPGTASSDGAVDVTPKTVQSATAWKKQRGGKVPDSGVGSDASMSAAWLDLEDALSAYEAAIHENKPDRGLILTSVVLPFLRREEENQAVRVNEMLAQRQRDILFGWLTTLTVELRELQPTHRGACLEAVSAIAESHFLSTTALQDDPAGQARYRRAVVQIVDFAVEKLNDKAVYANTLVFSGRVFALAFFRIEGVALKLLRALPPVKRHGLKRILEEVGVKETELPQPDFDAFPEHLHDLCLRDFRSYANLLLPPKSPPGGERKFLVKDGEVEVEMTGNWLIRWTASDSDLPFAFYRAWHRQLAAHLVPFEARPDIVDQPRLDPKAIITAPGFLFLAASILDKAESLVHRNLRSVTSIGPNSGAFNTNDSANLSFGQKPKVLELAHRRIVQTMLDIIGGSPSPSPDVDVPPDADARRHLFSGMLQVWVRASVKRTSMYDTRSVYILLDLLEGFFLTLTYPAAPKADDDEDAPPPKPDVKALELLDTPFIFGFVRIILEKADNTVSLLRTISFLYSNFEILTFRVNDRTELCEKLILDESLFQRLFLHWNSGVRGYFIRLLVWRVSRLGVVAQEQNPNLPPDQGIIAIFNLLNVRLEAVRKRHDALEPLDSLVDEDVYFRPKRSTICSTRGVKEAPWTVDELAGTLEEESDMEDEDEPEEVVRALPPTPPSASSAASVTSSKKGDLKTVAKVVSWLKGGLGKKQGKGKNAPGVPDQRIDPFVLERSATVKTRGRQDSLGGVTIEDDDLSAETASQEWPAAPLPTTVETGIVPAEDSPGPHTAPAPVESQPSANLAVPNQNPPAPPKLTRSTSSRSEKRVSRSFFSFEFENGVITRTDVDPNVAASGGSNASTTSNGTSDTNFPSSPIRARHGDPHSAISPRVSLRFSKRISILPPAALDLLKEATGAAGRSSIEAVPPIPAQYRKSVHVGYEKKLHPYAVRGLRDYEDALDEWTDWVARLQEEEDLNGKPFKTYVDMVPRLAVNWPLQSGGEE